MSFYFIFFNWQVSCFLFLFFFTKIKQQQLLLLLMRRFLFATDRKRSSREKGKVIIQSYCWTFGWRRVDATYMYKWVNMLLQTQLVVKGIHSITTVHASMCVQNKTKHSEGIPVSYQRWLYRLHISQAPFLCHYSPRFTVRKANKLFSKTDQYNVFQKNMGDFPRFLANSEKAWGAPTHYLAIVVPPIIHIVSGFL
jgi:hypothetical protein